MSFSAELSNFIRDALNRGLTKEDITKSLDRSGWTAQEIEQALSAWSHDEVVGAIPRAVRSTAAWDTLFYALLFAAFGMVVGNVLTLALGQITLWLPEAGDNYMAGGLPRLRWAMAALIIFTPSFLWLHQRDIRSSVENPANRYGAPRRWLTAIAIFAAAMALLCNGLYLIYRFLEGDLTVRFVFKTATVAAISCVVLHYFQQDRKKASDSHANSNWNTQLACWLSPALAILVLVSSFWTIGGPAQGRREHLDRLRISDIKSLERDVANCLATKRGNLPETLNPMTCARNPERLSGFASTVTYQRIDLNRFQLCVKVNEPQRIRSDGNLHANQYCVSKTIR